MIEIRNDIKQLLENIDEVPTIRLRESLYFDISIENIQYLENLCHQLIEEFDKINSDNEKMKISMYFANAERLIKHSYAQNKGRFKDER